MHQAELILQPANLRFKMKMKKAAHFIFVTRGRRHAVLTMNAVGKLQIQSLTSISTKNHTISQHSWWLSGLLLSFTISFQHYHIVVDVQMWH